MLQFAGKFFRKQCPNNFTWSKSSNISLSSTSNTSITASTTVNNSGQGWVSINFNGQELARHNVAVGNVAALSTIGCETGYGVVDYPTQWYAYYYSGGNVYWMAYNNDDSGYPGNVSNTYDNAPGTYATITFSEPGSYDVVAYTMNPCGSSVPVTQYSYYVYDFSASFNPVSSEIEIGIDDGQAGKSITSSNQFTVTVLDSNGTAKVQKSSLGSQLKVSANNLSDGTYSVRISNGNINEIRQITIKR